MGFSDLCHHWLLDPLKDAIGLRLRYFAASRSRWLALGLLIAGLVTMLAIPEMNLTGTRWAAFLPVLVAYLMGRLSTGVALFDHVHVMHSPDNLGFGVPTDSDDDFGGTARV